MIKTQKFPPAESNRFTVQAVSEKDDEKYWENLKLLFNDTTVGKVEVLPWLL